MFIFSLVVLVFFGGLYAGRRIEIQRDISNLINDDKDECGQLIGWNDLDTTTIHIESWHTKLPGGWERIEHRYETTDDTQ